VSRPLPSFSFTFTVNKCAVDQSPDELQAQCAYLLIDKFYCLGSMLEG